MSHRRLALPSLLSLLALGAAGCRIAGADVATPPADGGVTLDPAHLRCAAGQDGCELLVRVPKRGGPATKIPVMHGSRDVIADRAGVYYSSCATWCVFLPVPPPVALLGAQGYRYHAVALADDGIYLATDVKQVLRIARSGPRPTQDEVLARDTAWSLAVDGHHVYWVTGEAGRPLGAIRAVPRRGGPAITIADGQPRPGAVASDGERVFWVNLGEWQHPDGTVRSVAASGGAVVELARGQEFPGAITVDDRHVYWVNRGHDSYSLHRVAKEGGTAVELGRAAGRAGTRRNRELVLVDGEHVYWNAQQRVVRVARRGGPVETVAGIDGDGDVVSFGFDGGSLYVAATLYRRR